MTNENKTLGQIAFESYKNNINSQPTVYGVIVSDWDKLLDLIKQSWEASATAVIQAFEEDKAKKQE